MNYQDHPILTSLIYAVFGLILGAVFALGV